MSIAAKLLLIVALLPVVALALAAHEAGHVIAGRAAGLRFLLLVVGPFKIERLRGRVRAGLNRNLAYYGGVSLVVPTGMHATRDQLRSVVAGGPVASLATGALALLAYFALDLDAISRADGPAAYYARTACLLYAVLSLALGAVTLLPNRLMGMPSDGARLLELSREGPASERDLAVMTLGLVAAGEMRPRDWDPALVAHAARDNGDDVNGVLGQLLAYWHELDRGHAEAAAARLRPLLQRIERVPAIYRGTLCLEGAYHEAVHGGEAASARAWLDRARGLPAEAYLRLRAEAAVRLVEGDERGALECIERAEQALATSIEAGMALAHADELRAMRRRMPA